MVIKALKELIYGTEKQRENERKRNIRIRRNGKNRGLKEIWTQKAIDKLTEIIIDKPEKFVGYEFSREVPAQSTIGYSSGLDVYKINNVEKSLIGFTREDSEYGDETREQEYSDPKEIAKYLFFEKTTSGMYSRNASEINNKKRNKFVNEINELTGRNIKKEIREGKAA